MRDLFKKPQNHLQLASDQEDTDINEAFSEQSHGAMEEEELAANHFQQTHFFESHEFCAFSLRSSPFGYDESSRIRYLHDLDDGKSSFELFPSHGCHHDGFVDLMDEQLPETLNPKPQADCQNYLLNLYQEGTEVRLGMLDSCSSSFQEEQLDEQAMTLPTQEESNHHSDPPKQSIRIYIEIPDEIFSQYCATKQQDCGPKKPGASEEKNFCSCSRSRCLKLYCQCFRKGQVCGLECKCQDCENTVQNQDKLRELREPKLSRLQEEDSCCNCKMSFCEKSYCVCARSGKGCSAKCRCFNCKNPNGRPRKY